jgi:DNA-binding NarL/FixJ family response regulator
MMTPRRRDFGLEGWSMPVRIAVSDPLPAYRRGMLATLDAAGFDPETPTDLLEWVRQEARTVVLLTLETAADWSLLARLRQEPTDVVVVAILSDASPSAYVRAVVAGAVTALPRDAAVDVVKHVFDEAVRGFSVLPVDVVQALAAPHHRTEDGPEIDPQELGWLRGLADGATVAQLAERNGYSERAMFRQLRELYAKLRVKNRTQALLVAHRQGWL